jgi:hypothetical protein
MQKYNIAESIFNCVDNEEKAYWLGFILADGSLQIRKSGQAVLKLSLAIEDKNHLQKFLNFIQCNMPIKEYLVGNGLNSNKSKSCEITITSKKIVEDLGKLGIGPRKSFTVEMPSVREDLVRHLIRGIWDGDGSVLFRKNKPTNTNFRPELQLCGNYKVLETVQNYLISKLSISKVNLCKTSSIFLFRYVGQAGQQVANYLYDNANVFLDRKYDKYLLIKDWKTLVNYPKNTKISRKVG